MDLPEVMALFNNSLEEGDPHSLWNLVSVREQGCPTNEVSP